MHPHILQQVPIRAQTEETFSILLGVFHTTLDFLQRLDLSHFCLPESTDWKLETDAAFSLKKISGLSNIHVSLLLQVVHAPVKLTGLPKDTASKQFKEPGEMFLWFFCKRP